jgi:putative PEP-CTERM system TPR-repeat lipoprotein
MSQGQYREAISVLEPARKEAPNDPQTLALLATAHIARHQYQIASGYLEQALGTSGGSPEVHATLGFSLLGSGQSDLGLDHLERAFRADPGQARIGIALTELYLRRGQPQLAVKAAEAVVERAPGNVIALNLLGVARGGAGDLRGARTAYEKAIAVDKGFLPAELNLGKLELAERNYPAARGRFEAILKAHPSNTQAMFELAATEESAGRPEEAIRWFEKVRSLDRGNVAATARLVDLHIAAKRAAQALEIAKETEAAAPENIEALAALGRAYVAVGNAALAQTVFGRMVRLAGFDADRQTQIARYQLAASNPQGAVYSLEKALAGNPEHLPAQVLLTEIDLERGEIAKAEQRARAIAKRRPDDPAGYRLLADIALARRQYPEAIEGYRAALSKEQTTAAALRLFRAYVASGKLAAANEFMETWIKSRPEDALAQRALAEGYLRAGNLAAARARYEDVLKRHDADPNVLNNLANILLLQGDKNALEYAEQAHRLAPGDALAQDTLGWVLVQQDQVDLGLRHLREARLRDPPNREIRYHLAAALARAGRRDEAKSELDEALRGDARFEGAADARKLMRELLSQR